MGSLEDERNYIGLNQTIQDRMRHIKLEMRLFKVESDSLRQLLGQQRLYRIEYDFLNDRNDFSVAIKLEPPKLF